MTITEFATRYQNGLEEHEIILDVRTAQEFLDKHIPGARNIPVDEVAEYTEELMGKKVYCVCRSGSRSQIAMLLLKTKEIDAVSIDGGTVAWVEKGLPTE